MNLALRASAGMLLAIAADCVLADLSEKIALELEKQGLAGAVWVTVHGIDDVGTGSAGLSNATSGEPMQIGNRVHVGSVVKPFIAIGILHLVSQGEFSLDTPLEQLVTNITLDNPWAATDPVTVRHLLDQTSGLDDTRFWQVFSEHATPDSPLSEAFTGSADLMRIRSRPGAHHSYSNMGFTLLGMVIEAVTGERYEDYLDRELLGALNMKDSTLHFVSQQGPTADPGLAMGHFENGRTQAAVPMVLRPSSQFTTTAGDMAHFLSFLMGDGRVDGRLFVAPELLHAMGRPVGTESADAGLAVGYGLGMFRRDRLGFVAPCHGGSTVGFNAMFCIFPEHNKAFFIAMNGDNEAADYTRLDALLIDALKLPGEAAIATQALPTDSNDLFGYYVPSPNRMQKFALLDLLFGYIHVQESEGGLLLTNLQRDPVMVHAVADNGLFRAADRIEASHVFFKGPDGESYLGRGTQSYRHIEEWKLWLGWASLGLALLGMAFIFLSGVLRAVSGRWHRRHPAWIPFLGIAALAIPLPFFLMQSFLAIGDINTASILLMLVSAALPISMVIGIGLLLRQWPLSRLASLEVIALVSVLQGTLFLAYWGLLPMRLWA